jgi:hypothetical protein
MDKQTGWPKELQMDLKMEPTKESQTAPLMELQMAQSRDWKSVEQQTPLRPEHMKRQARQSIQT